MARSIRARRGSTSVPRADLPAVEGSLHVLPADARRFRAPRARLFAFCAAIAVVMVSGAVLYDSAISTDFAAAYLAPCWEHPFGTDWMGRDIARTVSGLAVSLGVSLVAAAATSVVALLLALVAALGGSRADAAVAWLTDLVLGIPHIILLILISYALGRGAAASRSHIGPRFRACCAPSSSSCDPGRIWRVRALSESQGCLLRCGMGFRLSCPSTSWDSCCCFRMPSSMRLQSRFWGSACLPSSLPSASSFRRPWVIFPRDPGGLRCFPGSPCSPPCSRSNARQRRCVPSCCLRR